jgi:hypothetical protein
MAVLSLEDKMEPDIYGKLYAKGSKSLCLSIAETLERTQGLKAWTVAPLDPEKGVWGLFIGEGATCDECGCHTDEVIGCPDGAEICRQCFDQGAH